MRKPKKSTTHVLCENIIRLEEEFEAYVKRYDSKVEGLETYNNTLRDVKLPKIESELREVTKMTEEVFDCIGRAKEVVDDAKKQVDSLTTKVLLIVIGGVLASAFVPLIIRNLNL